MYYTSKHGEMSLSVHKYSLAPLLAHCSERPFDSWVKAVQSDVNKTQHPVLLAAFSVGLHTSSQVLTMQLFVIVIVATLAAAQLDPIQDFCRRHQHQTCVIDSKLYIDGGKVYYGGSVDNSSVARQSNCNKSRAHKPR